MFVVDEWDGRRACALEEALRMSGEEFAAKLGVAVRTVRDWHRRPDLKPRPVQQQALDTLLEQSTDEVKARLIKLLGEERQHESDVVAAPAIEPLTVGVAVVVTNSDVLVVCRRQEYASGISWQFPAGVVKPGGDPAAVAVRETFTETGVHCVVRERLGRRLHPVTGVYCEYFLCEYLAGDPENRDQVENTSVMWVCRAEITRFISEDLIYPPILRALLEDHEAAAS